MEIPKNSQYKERMKYLLKNQHFGRTPLDDDLEAFSNCHGTSLWVLGATEKIKGDKGMILRGTICSSQDIPLYMGADAINYFVWNYCEMISKQPDTFFAVKSWVDGWEEGQEYETYVHSGIYLGRNVCFDQNDRGGEFRLCSLEESVRKYSFDFSGLEFFRVKPSNLK